MNGAALVQRYPARHVSRERLVTALVFALLAHGIVLLGIGFVALVPHIGSGTSVSVTLVNAANRQAPNRADYLAQAGQRGPGNTQRHIAARPAAASNDPFPNPGFALAESFSTFAPDPALSEALAALAPRKDAGPQELITTRAEVRPVASGTPVSAGNERPPLVARLRIASQQSGATISPTVALPRLYGAHPESLAHTANARASIYAPYLLAWQQRIERIGTAQFAQLVPADIASGHLTLAVTLASDGSVRAVEILKRSQYSGLDAAALKIIRLSAPFAPFPPAVRAHSAALTFTYRWNFIRNGASTGTLGIGTDN